MTLSDIEKTKKDAEYYRKKIGVKKKDPQELEKILNRIEETLEKMAKSSGMSVEELADALDPSNPWTLS
jgi:hypothetical protein